MGTALHAACYTFKTKEDADDVEKFLQKATRKILGGFSLMLTHVWTPALYPLCSDFALIRPLAFAAGDRVRMLAKYAQQHRRLEALAALTQLAAERCAMEHWLELVLTNELHKLIEREPQMADWPTYYNALDDDVVLMDFGTIHIPAKLISHATAYYLGVVFSHLGSAVPIPVLEPNYAATEGAIGPWNLDSI